MIIYHCLISLECCLGFFFQKSRRKENLIRGSVLRFEKFSFPIILLVRFVTIVSVSHMLNDAYKILTKVVVDLSHFSTLKSQ